MNTSSLTLNGSQKIGSKFTLEKVCEPLPPRKEASNLWGHTRYLILGLAVLSFTAARSNDLTFTFSVICMTANNTGSGEEAIVFSPRDLSLSFAGAGTGAIIASLPLALLLQRFGGRIILGSLLLASACGTLLLPLAAKSAVVSNIPIATLLFPLRIVQGLAVAAVMPMMGFVSAHWAPVNEIGNFVTILSGSAQLSQIITMPISAHLCVTIGWPWTYYFHGIIAILSAIAFIFFFTNSPKKHRFVGEEELQKITDGMEHRKRKDQTIPYRAIATSRPVWAVWFAFLGNSFGFQLTLQFMPTYLNKVLGVPIERTGLSAILPPIAQLFIKLIAGIISDKIKCFSERRKLQLFNSIAMCGCALFLLPIGFLRKEDSTIVLFCFAGSISCLGMVTCGSMKSTTMVARQYSHFVMSIVQFVVCIGMLGVPFIVSTFAPDNTEEQWRVVFFLVAIILLSTNLVFCVLCDSEPASWTKTAPALSAKALLLLPDDPQATVATIAENI